MSLPFLNTAPAPDQRDEAGCVDGPPPGLCRFDELERHPDTGGRALGDSRAKPDGGEGGLDRVGGVQVDPVLGGVVVEGVDYLEHWRSFPSGAQRRHMIRLAMGYRASSGRCAPDPAEDHPQVLIIARLSLATSRGSF
jgi:hypothetical protein